MSLHLRIKQRDIFIIALSLAGALAVSGTYAFGQYAAQTANNNTLQGAVRTATIQECAQACAGNAACASFVYYTQNNMAGACQFTSSQTPLNINGAISGVPFRGAQFGSQNAPSAPVNQNSYRNLVRGQSNYSVTPITYGRAASAPQPQYQAQPQYQPSNVSQSGAISFVRPETSRPQQANPAPMPQYNPPPQIQRNQQSYTPAANNNAPNVNAQYSNPQANNAADVNYQTHSRQSVPEYSVARAIQQANVQENQAVQQRQQLAPDTATTPAPVQEANLGPLRPPLKTQMEYDKYRDKDGMVDAAAMRRDMLKNEKSPRYAVENEWQGIAQTSDANNAAKIIENSAPVPLPPEVTQQDLLTEDKSDKSDDKSGKTKKQSLWSKIFKHDTEDTDQNTTQDTDDNGQNDGPLRRK